MYMCVSIANTLQEKKLEIDFVAIFLQATCNHLTLTVKP